MAKPKFSENNPTGTLLDWYFLDNGGYLIGRAIYHDETNPLNGFFHNMKVDQKPDYKDHYFIYSGKEVWLARKIHMKINGH